MKLKNTKQNSISPRWHLREGILVLFLIMYLVHKGIFIAACGLVYRYVKTNTHCRLLINRGTTRILKYILQLFLTNLF